MSIPSIEFKLERSVSASPSHTPTWSFLDSDSDSGRPIVNETRSSETESSANPPVLIGSAPSGPSTSPPSDVRRKTRQKVVRKAGIDPKIHGHIPGIPVLSTFLNRKECSHAGVHAHTFKGIHGSKDEGAYSVVMSGGYEDDQDKGETFIYTGEGGRATTTPNGKKTRSGPQIRDQEWTGGNKSLQLSLIHNTPVRVVRGGQNFSSRYAPTHGYRYDGLYEVTEAILADGKTGFKTCQFTFQRLPGQPPLPNEVLRPAPSKLKRRRSSASLESPTKRKKVPLFSTKLSDVGTSLGSKCKLEDDEPASVAQASGEPSDDSIYNDDL
ncbi:E3 ubiquitin-protein ligase ORTHRUS 2 [Mycena sanguinolenta]|uniref:E3 ubiquitin-protein ligase ORTHRUS 2 n=1 Tax=Mycena sanguinolenta TaxID=230812 RepID=A0A8H6XTV0_9AGAR|nr:E3 ubiquitin-protein ligase ORTHRUS 2 [Mycena sanguinolenta]